MRPLTTEQQALVGEVGTFLAAERPAPCFATLDDRFDHLVGYQRRLNAAGLAVPSWPANLGGRGLGPADAAVVSRALGMGGAPELINFVGTDIVAAALLRHVDQDRLKAWMPKMAAAEEIWCQLFSEPGAGSDLAGLRTRAVAVRGGYRITGQKVWSTWAQYATWGLLLARTGTPESRHGGITAFVLPMDAPGITIRPLMTMTGSAEFAEVFLDEVHVAADAVVGEVDGGWSVAQLMLDAERGPYAVRRAAVIGASVEWVLMMARRRRLDAPTRDQVVRAVTTFRLLELRIDTLVDGLAAGVDIGTQAPVVKQLMTNAEQAVFDVSMRLRRTDVLGWDDPVTGLAIGEYLYSRAASIYGGTAQIQRNIIGERLLGLPREPAAPSVPARTS
jgi:alkylation response protein AidB-like acyl-CoA dehydrogenase